MSKWLNTTHIQDGKNNGEWNEFYQWLQKGNKPCHATGYCPYGALVEAYPLYPDAERVARDHEMYIKHKGELMPDIDKMIDKGLLDTKYNCRVFGHHCPAFYMAEPIAEECMCDECKGD